MAKAKKGGGRFFRAEFRAPLYEDVEDGSGRTQYFGRDSIVVKYLKGSDEELVRQYASGPGNPFGPSYGGGVHDIRPLMAGEVTDEVRKSAETVTPGTYSGKMVKSGAANSLLREEGELRRKLAEVKGKLSRVSKKDLEGLSARDNAGGRGMRGTLAVVGLAGALLFLSPAVTGNAIGSINTSVTSVIGAGAFLAGLVGAFLWMKKR